MALQRLGHAVQPLQQVGWLEVQVRQGVGGGAQLGHHRRGLRPVTHDVADDEAGPVAAQRDDVVPVAADDVARGRQAPPRDLQPGGHRRLGGQQAALQRVGDRPVPHQRQRVDDRRSGLGSQPGGGRDVAAAERGRARVAREHQHPDDRVARGQRDRQERAAAGHDLAPSGRSRSSVAPSGSAKVTGPPVSMQRAYGELGAKAMTWPGGKASRETRWPARAKVVPSLRVTTSPPHRWPTGSPPLSRCSRTNTPAPSAKPGTMAASVSPVISARSRRPPSRRPGASAASSSGSAGAQLLSAGGDAGPGSLIRRPATPSGPSVT